MLDSKIFIAGINKIGNLFINFKLTEEQAKAWYEMFKNYTEEQYKKMIRMFLENSDFPPQSPRSITKYYEGAINDAISQSNPTPDKAWQTVVQGIRAHGLTYNPDKFYEYIKQHGGELTEQCARDFHRELQQLEVGDTFTAHAFKNAYKTYLQRDIKDKRDKAMGKVLLNSDMLKKLIGFKEDK